MTKVNQAGADLSDAVVPAPALAKTANNWLIPGALLLLSVAGLGAIVSNGLDHLIHEWDSPEYSHGYLIPVVSIVIAWLKRHEIGAAHREGAWIGVAITTFALVLAVAGTFGTIYFLVHVSMVIAVCGLTLVYLGWRGLLVFWFPIIFLLFMIPLPDFITVKISAELQLLSSSLGVNFIRLFGIIVFLEGNVIDLGNFKVQVVEACDGLRYMFPLMSFSFLFAYLYNGPLWQRVIIFLSSIPITILMNSVRIGAIGVLHEFSGVNAAEGLLHDFQGWAIFIVCLFIFLIEVWVFTLFSRGRKSFFDHFSLLNARPARRARHPQA